MDLVANENNVELDNKNVLDFKAVYCRAEACRFSIYIMGALQKHADATKAYDDKALGEDVAKEMRSLKLRLQYYKDKQYEPKQLVAVPLYGKTQKILWQHALNK